MDIWRPAGQRPRRIGRGAPMPDEQNGGHGRQRNSQGPMEHNVGVIRGMGWYSSEGMVSTAQLHMGDGDVSEVRAALADFESKSRETPGSFVWLGLFEPTREELYGIAEILTRLTQHSGQNSTLRMMDRFSPFSSCSPTTRLHQM